MAWLTLIALIGAAAWFIWRERRRGIESTPAEALGPDPSVATYLVMQGPEKGLMVRLDPGARWGSPGVDGNWVCVDVNGQMFVSPEGLESQLGMVVLDLWALLGPEEAQATLDRRMFVLPEPRLHEVEADLGGFQAMPGWLEVPSVANYQPPEPGELPELIPLILRFADTRVRLALSGSHLLEVAGGRTHPTASPREALPEA